MITVPSKKVAIIPVYDPNETKGGIIKPASFNYLREKVVYNIYTPEAKKIDEAEDIDRARELVERYNRRGWGHFYRKNKTQIEDQPLDSGERCDQGVVKYIGKDVKDIQIGDYVFFSGYSGTLVQVEGEGKLIILPESFIEFKMDIDKFIQVPGLYFKDKEGKFFTATYEQAMNIMAVTFTDLGLTYDVKTTPPKLEDYNVKR